MVRGLAFGELPFLKFGANNNNYLRKNRGWE